jgi:hypothetical protein
LYALCGLLVVAFVLEARLAISTVAHQAVQIAILVFVFSLIFRWIHANDRGLAQEEPLPDWPPLSPARTEETPKEDDRPGPSRHLFHLPQGGLRHTLSDTFHLDQSEDQPSPAQNSGRRS